MLSNEPGRVKENFGRGKTPGHGGQWVRTPPKSSLSPFLVFQVLIIRIGEKEPLPSVAPEQDMVNPARIMNPRFACHGMENNTTQSILSSWKPDPITKP
jgi:hypothetical protein